MKQLFNNVAKLTRYNIKIIFGNKFIYFMLSAIAFFILTVVITLFDDTEITEASAYGMLITPALLLIFYPTCFGIQNDQDSKIIEIIFGIPNYRYKVWLFRLAIGFIICFVLTSMLAVLVDLFIVEIPPLELAFQIMFPALFIGTLCFMLSTIIRNGNGTAVVIIIIGLFFFILNQALGASKWNVFLNPFDVPLDKNPALFYQTVFDNHIIVFIASFIFLLIGLSKMQNREKFV